jgi:putative Holliday junction resolvase
MKQGSVLGFDFGLKQIGVSVGQTVTGSARPLTLLKANDGKPQWPQIEKLIGEWQPMLLVVGLPLNMDGTESSMSARARKFANRLHGRYGLKVELHDERLSSQAVRSGLADGGSQGGSRRIAHNKIDALAAAVVLQSWLDNYCS